jgi:hypothetical protein
VVISVQRRVTDRASLLKLLAVGLDLGSDDGYADLSSLVAAALALPPTVIVVDNAHRLFMRRIGGFEALSTFQAVVTATSHRHLWISSYDGYAWTFIRHTERKPRDGALRELVDARMGQTPLQATFEALNLDADPTRDHMVNLDQSAGGYFRLLEEATRGNPRVAMEYWLGSLNPTGTQQMRVNLFEPLAKKRLVALGDNARFVLVALVQHVELSLDELAQTLNFPPSLIAEILVALDDMGVIDRDADTGQAWVNARTYSSVTTFLEGQNLLHV